MVTNHLLTGVILQVGSIIKAYGLLDPYENPTSTSWNVYTQVETSRISRQKRYLFLQGNVIFQPSNFRGYVSFQGGEVAWYKGLHLCVPLFRSCVFVMYVCQMIQSDLFIP